MYFDFINIKKLNIINLFFREFEEGDAALHQELSAQYIHHKNPNTILSSKIAITPRKQMITIVKLKDNQKHLLHGTIPGSLH